MKPLNVTLCSFLCAFLGVVGYMVLATHLDKAYRPFSSDIPAWIIYAFPTGAILGAVSGYAVASHLNRNYSTPGITCIATGAMLIFCYVQMFRHTLSLYSFDYAASESGPALIWSSVVLVYGLFLVSKRDTQDS